MRRHNFSKVLTRVSLGILFSPLDSSPRNPSSLLLVTDEYLVVYSPRINMASDSFNVNLQDCMNSLLFLQRLPALTLLCRDASGRVVSSNFSNEHLISGINIARVALTTDPVRAALEKVALRICTGGSDFWFSQLPGPDNMTYQQATHSFIEKIRAEFPLVFVDYSLQNPDSKGFHTRRKWLGQFVPRHQAISINGKVNGTFFILEDLGP